NLERTCPRRAWLAPGHRGRGIGKETRAAVLHLAFAGLEAREAESDVFTDNNASNRVSQALGYEPNGTTWDTRRGEVARAEDAGVQAAQRQVLKAERDDRQQESQPEADGDQLPGHDRDG